MGTNRLEAFSDGVIAVAITLLVLNIDVPGHDSARSLGHELLAQWPQYAAYAVSFLTIGIIWINHHAMISRLREADHAILILNLLLLMTIGALPFATDLMAKYLRDGAEQSLVAAIYAGCFLLMALSFSVLNRHVLLRKAHFLHEPLPLDRRRAILVRVRLGLIPYAAGTALAFVSPYVTLGICAALAVYYATPAASRL
jgi:uncharacterized membrane protein